MKVTSDTVKTFTIELTQSEAERLLKMCLKHESSPSGDVTLASLLQREGVRRSEGAEYNLTDYGDIYDVRVITDEAAAWFREWKP